ncbi:MAG: hypothetical protein U0163_04910 [Gemmatimonadaceae bacterium]
MPTLRGDTAALGFEVASALRARLASDLDIRALMVVPESAITKALVEAGFAPRQALAPAENRQLASQFQADEFVDGSVRRTADGGVHVELGLAIGRRDDLVQPLPPVEGRKVSDVARLLSQEVQLARKQIESVRTCMDQARAGDYAKAIVAAQKALAVYPRSSLARVCLANVYAGRGDAPDSVIRIADEILAVDPGNRRALALSADALVAAGRRADATERLVQLADKDSADVPVVERAARALAEAKAFARADSLLLRGLRVNPSDPPLLALRWRVALARGDWPGATAIGRELVSVDSAAADADFYRRMAAAFVEDSQPSEAAAIAGEGARKFPVDDELALLEIQLLRRSGQPQKAIEAANRLIALRPQVRTVWIHRARPEAELKAPADSVLASLAQSVAAGDDTALVAGYAATLGQSASRTAQASKSLDDFRTAVRYFAFAERTMPRDTTAFLLGAAHVALGQQLYVHAREEKNCSQAKEMQDALAEAQVQLTRGGRAFPDLAAQLLARVAEVSPYARQLERAVCH